MCGPESVPEAVPAPTALAHETPDHTLIHQQPYGVLHHTGNIVVALQQKAFMDANMHRDIFGNNLFKAQDSISM